MKPTLPPEEELLARMDALLKRHRPESFQPVSEVTQEIPLLTEIVNELGKTADVSDGDAPPEAVPVSATIARLEAANAGAMGTVSPAGGASAKSAAFPVADLEARIRAIVRSHVGPLVDELARRIALELGAAPQSESPYSAGDGTTEATAEP
jgi:hypothetical protein